jgi:Zn-dependent M28 family amino/carboxypeptidase
LAIARQSAPFRQKGALAVVLVADSIAETAMGFLSGNGARGTYAVDSAEVDQRPRPQMPIVMVRQGLSATVLGAATIAMDLRAESFTYPSVNLVAMLPGTDKARGEVVLFSGHQDHDGVRYPVDGDSIYNGADDNGSVAVAMLAIARAWKAEPGKRGALFVWHGAEERGLLGSNYYSAHPTVPRDSIVAVLNADMIGRGNPDSASLLGVQPPHLNSRDLVSLAFAANARTGKFALDSIWDRPSHPEGWYFRSDHLPYARRNIPAVEYSTNTHPDYHTPRDEPSRIDYTKLTKMAQWMYLTGKYVGDAKVRPGLEPGFKLER